MARRSRRGGPRSGSPGQAYPNRTDLNTAGNLPVATAPSAEYGSRVAQERSQQVVPMGPGGAPMPQGGAAPPAMPGIQPGGLPPLFAATARPDEPVTSGAASGPGPGPNSLGMAEDMAQADLRALAPYMPVLIYHSRKASPSYVMWLRTLRSGS